METARVHVFIEGRVQGVFYRSFTRNLAGRLGLHGWVRNLHDGRVEAVFEGERRVIQQAINECRKGPPGASVINIEISWEEHSENLRGFEIRY